MRALHCLVVGIVLLTAAAASQGVTRDTPPTQASGTARLSGRVFAADTGRPLRGAIVHIVSMRAGNPNERQGRWVTTDAEGRWELRDATAGRYTVAASKSGYLRIQYGQQRPFELGRTIELRESQPVEKIDLTLPRAGAITGRVVDEYGDPVTSAFVSALRYRYVDGQRQLTPIAEGIESLATNGGLTDDLGHYRLHGLAPGEYVVSALFVPPGESANRAGYPPSFSPGAASAAEAQRISVRIGQEVQNVHVTLVSVRYARVSGTVINSAGAPIKASVSLTGAAPVLAPTGGSGLAGADGTFAIHNVPPGEYRLHAWLGGAGTPESASLPVTVSGQDISGLTLVTAPGATATGRIIFEGEAPPDVRLWIRTTAAASGAPTFMNSSVGLRPDSTFEARGLVDRQTFRVGNLPEGWFLKSITHAGVDITDSGYVFKPGQNVSGIDITLTQRATTLAGTVTDDRGRAVADYTIVAFSSDSSRWNHPSRYVRGIRPDQDGKFSIRGLPPDDYLLVALEYLETGQEADPEQLEKLRPQGTKVTLGDGETKLATLQVRR